MTVIGVDPGIERTGVGIVKKEGNQFKLIHGALITTSSSYPQAYRLADLYQQFNQVLEQYPADCASIEKLYFAKNIKTALNVSEARGVLLLALQNKGIPIHEYTPLQVKQGLTGYGRGTKQQVQELVRIILNLKDGLTQDDMADGIALAITHLNTSQFFRKVQY